MSRDSISTIYLRFNILRTSPPLDSGENNECSTELRWRVSTCQHPPGPVQRRFINNIIITTSRLSPSLQVAACGRSRMGDFIRVIQHKRCFGHLQIQFLHSQTEQEDEAASLHNSPRCTLCTWPDLGEHLSLACPFID